MENYNLTAEIKKISGAINNSSPNTKLGNINSSVGNLDTAMQGVATAINGLSIPNPGSNIDGVATAINNKTIPDNTSNITAVANAIVSMAGGKDLDDLIAILTTMNGNIANLGSNHIIDIVEHPGGYLMYKGDGAAIPLPNQAKYTTYTDTNNIGATDVQGAIDKLSGATNGTLTINSNYAAGSAFYQKCGKVVTVFIADLVFRAQPPSGAWSTPLISGLPKAGAMNGGPKIVLYSFDSNYKIPVRLAFGPGNAELFFHWTITSGVPTNTIYNATFSYICE